MLFLEYVNNNYWLHDVIKYLCSYASVMLVTTDAAKFKADSDTGVGISTSLGNGVGGRAVTPMQTHTQDDYCNPPPTHG